MDVSEIRFIEFEQRFDGYTDLDPAIPSSDYNSNNSGNLIYIRPVYDQSKIPLWQQQDLEVHSDSGFPVGILTLAILLTLILVGSAIAIKKHNDSREIEFAEIISEEDES